MYFMSKEEELIGKEIAFTHIAEFAEAITLVTKDKGVMVIQQQNYEDCNSRTRIYHKSQAYYYVMNHEWLRRSLHDNGVITDDDVDSFKKEVELRRQKAQEEYLKQQEIKERKMYEQLKEKFESQ